MHTHTYETNVCTHLSTSLTPKSSSNISFVYFYFQAWKVERAKVHAQKLVRGYKIAGSPQAIKFDHNQMGGDFVLSEDGHFLFVHCCNSPADRPAVSALLGALHSN